MHLRVPLIAGWMVTIVPLGAFLIASNNPGSWAVIGVGGSWLATLGWFRSSGRRAWALGALSVVSVLIAAGARTDAAVYSVIGLGIASVLGFERTGTFRLKLILPGALVVVAAVLFGEGWTNDIRAMVVSSIISLVLGSVTGFFLGTSYGSQRKTDMLAER